MFFLQLSSAAHDWPRQDRKGLRPGILAPVSQGDLVRQRKPGWPWELALDRATKRILEKRLVGVLLSPWWLDLWDIRYLFRFPTDAHARELYWKLSRRTCGSFFGEREDRHDYVGKQG